jgi:[protein-PII] uridylyltransferase
VTAPDRMGFLFSVTYTLFQLDLQIHLAKITTNVDQVLDVFYVTDRNGRKVANPKQLEATLKERLTLNGS